MSDTFQTMREEFRKDWSTLETDSKEIGSSPNVTHVEHLLFADRGQTLEDAKFTRLTQKWMARGAKVLDKDGVPLDPDAIQASLQDSGNDSIASETVFYVSIGPDDPIYKISYERASHRRIQPIPMTAEEFAADRNDGSAIQSAAKPGLFDWIRHFFIKLGNLFNFDHKEHGDPNVLNWQKEQKTFREKANARRAVLQDIRLHEPEEVTEMSVQNLSDVSKPPKDELKNELKNEPKNELQNKQVLQNEPEEDAEQVDEFEQELQNMQDLSDHLKVSEPQNMSESQNIIPVQQNLQDNIPEPQNMPEPQNIIHAQQNRRSNIPNEQSALAIANKEFNKDKNALKTVYEHMMKCSEIRTNTNYKETAQTIVDTFDNVIDEALQKGKAPSDVHQEHTLIDNLKYFPEKWLVQLCKDLSKAPFDRNTLKNKVFDMSLLVRIGGKGWVDPEPDFSRTRKYVYQNSKTRTASKADEVPSIKLP